MWVIQLKTDQGNVLYKPLLLCLVANSEEGEARTKVEFLMWITCCGYKDISSE